MADLSTRYLGLDLKNPLIVASCGFTDSVSSIANLEENGAAAVVLKSLFEEEIRVEMEASMQRMTNSSYIYPETFDFYENALESKDSTTEFLKLIEDAKKRVNIPIIPSINCITAQEWTYFPKQIESAGADALELNIFVTPSDFSRTGAENEQVYFDIIEAVKAQVNIPIAVKLSYYFSNLGSMLQRLSETGIGSLVLFNRFYSPDIDLQKMEITSSSILSSPEDLTISLRWIAIMAERVKCDLAASTGVHDGSGLIKQLLAGADAVQVASTLYRNGAQHLHTMIKELEGWMKERGYDSVDDFRGLMSQERTQNPAAYERVQFMRYFQGVGV